jgi:signal transduction histidine kinase/PAS domain-containing protein
MVNVDESVLADPVRLAAVERARRVLPELPFGPDVPARLAARLVGAPSARLSLVGRAEEHLIAGYGPPAPAVGRYVVSAGGTVDGGAFLGTPVRDEAGHPVGALAVLDTAPRAWTAAQAAALAEVAAVVEMPAADAPPEPPGGTAQFLGALLESLSVGVIACAEDGAVVLINRPVREIMNLPAEGALHNFPVLADGVLFDPQGRRIPWRDAPLQRAARGERVVDADMIIRIPGRPERTFATTAQPIEGRDGRRLGAVAIAQEVTALRRAERFRTCHVTVGRVLQSAGSAEEAAPGVLAAVGLSLGWPAAELWLVDEDGGDLRHAGGWCAPGSHLGAILGNTPVRGTGITGRVWASGRPLLVPDIADTGTLRSQLDRSRAAACLRHGIRTVLSVPVRDGDTVLGVLTCYAGAPEQRDDLLTVLLDGVAAQIGVHVALRRAEQLARQLTRAKDDFIALVGHEMRTPLTSIVASASMLGEDAAALDQDSRALVEAVQRNATGLRDVVDTLLDLAGLDSGYLTLTVRRVDLTALVAQAAAAAAGSAAATGVRIEVCRTEPLWLAGDAHRLRQVVDDLLANAVKFSPCGGDVRVGLGECDGLAELTVADHGLGTPAEERDRVFDRFYRAGNVRHQGIAGNGLGLSLARTIVHLHGGTIRLTGDRPHGTTVRVRLPVAGP